MKKRHTVLVALLTTSMLLFTACGQSATEETEASAQATTLTLLNIKSEVSSQMEELAAKYKQETGITVNVITVVSGVDSQAMLKGYYLSDQMPDIIACESAGFDNWEGLLVDMSDQSWASRTDSEYVDDTYGTLGFPYATEAIGLAYNADLLEKAGVDPTSITGPEAMEKAFARIDEQKEALGLTAVVAYSAEPENLGWSAGNHITGAYFDSGLGRSDRTYIDLMAEGGKLDDSRFAAFAHMIALFNQYSDPDLLVEGTYDQQLQGFASGKYAFITQGSWIGAALTGDYADAYAKSGNFSVGMVPYAFEDGMDTILTSAPNWWAVSKEGNVDEALAFLQWCSEDTAQQILVQKAGFVSPFVDCKYVASDPFAQVISDYISAGKTSAWHWMEMASGLGQNGLSYVYQEFARGDLDEDGFIAKFQKVAAEWYAKL